MKERLEQQTGTGKKRIGIYLERHPDSGGAYAASRDMQKAFPLFAPVCACAP